MNRGDVILVRFPHPSGLRGKKRPAVVVQADEFLGLSTVLVSPTSTKALPASFPPTLPKPTKPIFIRTFRAGILRSIGS